MSITIHLEPEVEARLIAQATAQGISVEQLLGKVIESLVVSPDQEKEKPFHETVTNEEWEALLDELSNIPALKNVPPLPDEALSRESIYTREDEIL